MKKSILLIAALAVVIAVAAAAYDALSGRMEPEIALAGSEDIPTGSDGPPSVAEDGAGISVEAGPEQQKAPDFTVTDIDGNEVKLSDFLGQPVVLNFWASWCPPCKEEMPYFETLYGEAGDKIAFLMVDLVDGGYETVKSGSAYIEEQGYTFPVYYDTLQEGAYKYGIASIPTTVFIDAQGYPVTGVIGGISEDNLRRGIDMITGEPGEE